MVARREHERALASQPRRRALFGLELTIDIKLPGYESESLIRVSV